MGNFLLGIVIIIGGLAITVASAAREPVQVIGFVLGLGFVLAGALIGSSGRR